MKVLGYIYSYYFLPYDSRVINFSDFHFCHETNQQFLANAVGINEIFCFLILLFFIVLLIRVVKSYLIKIRVKSIMYKGKKYNV